MAETQKKEAFQPFSINKDIKSKFHSRYEIIKTKNIKEHNPICVFMLLLF